VKSKQFLQLLLIILLTAANLFFNPVSTAQRPRFSQPTQLPALFAGQATVTQQPGVPIVVQQNSASGMVNSHTVSPANTLPQLPAQSGQPIVGSPPMTQGQTFDPFATQGGWGQPATVSPQVQGGLQPGAAFSQGVPAIYPPANSQPLLNQGPYVPLQTAPGQGTVPGWQTGPGTYFPPAYQGAAWPAGSNAWSESATAWPSQVWARFRSSNMYRLLERPRFRHTFIEGGDKPNDFGVNESELATTLTIANFLWSTQPVRISPGFIFHFWDGPAQPGLAGFLTNLPSNAYSTYLAADYSTRWDRVIGGELNFTIGVYSDFQEVTTDSIRLTGVGLGWYRLTPTTTLKFGVEYLDRLDIKLLPAGGLFIQPTPDIKLNLYFPRPKIARRLPNFQNLEVWGYAGGEYGGGSWTVERFGGIGDQVDYNDIRVFLGLEWLTPAQITGFFEGGYVFERELIYKRFDNSLDLSDSFMLRAGIAF